jgi:hypothetical protein
MRPMESILRTGSLRIKENNGGVNLTILYCNQFCKCHYVNPVQQHNDKKNKNEAIYHVKHNMELEVVTDISSSWETSIWGCNG